MTKLSLAPLVLMTVACGVGKAPLSPTVPSTSVAAPSAQAAALFTLSGLVFENRAGTRQAVAGAGVVVWGVPCGAAVTLPPGVNNCRTWYSTITGNYLVSDAEGRFVAPDVPGSVVTIMPAKRGYVQPCAAIVAVHGDLTTEIELVPVESFNTANPQPLMTTRPLVVGTVFEMTADGPKGVAGASVFIDTDSDLTVADTLTDLTGRFTLCGGTGGIIYAGKAAYGYSAEASPVNGMAIEIKRQ